MLTEFFVFLFFLILSLFWINQKPKNIPPGEWGLPFVGYLPFMTRKITKTLDKLAKKHGKIFTLKLGTVTYIVLSDYSLIKSALQRPEISGRPFYYNMTVLRNTSHLGTAFANDQIWLTNRRFSIRTLRDFGLGKTPILDEIILNEAGLLIKDLRQQINKPIKVEWNINVAGLNVIFCLMSSRHYDVNDKVIKEFARDVNDNIEDMEGPLSIFTIIPGLIPFIPKFVKDKWMRQAKMEERRKRIFGLIKSIIKEHKVTLDKANPRDYIDKYLIEQEEQKNNPEFKHWGDEDLISNIFDFFVAGSETSSSTIRWFFLYVARFPEIQKRVQKEIDEILPKGQLPSLHDRDNLPALEALTYEISRVITLLPTGLPHEVTEDTVLEGYVIPKGTVVLPYIEACHRSSQYFKYPNTFSLDNFLDDDGKVIRNKEGFLPFSLGRRICLGESLAKMELFIFMGAILQNFEISEPEGQNVPLVSTEETNIVNYAPHFNVILQNRN